MNKIFKYSLGVFSLLNAAVTYAAEKFDVLPDLPDPLVQSAQAASVSGTAGGLGLGTQSVGHEPGFISVFFSLIFVILLIYLTGIIYAKLNKSGVATLKKQQGDFAKSHANVISTTQLGNNKTLHVVELDGKRMLIGASTGAIQLIKDLGSVTEDEYDGEFSHIEIPNIRIPKIEIPKIEFPGFAKMVTKTHKNFEEIENENDMDSDNTENEQSVHEDAADDLGSDGIIDSLFTPQPETIEDENVTSEHTVDPDEYALYKKYLG